MSFMGSDLMYGMDRCFFLMEMNEERVRKGGWKNIKIHRSVVYHY